MRREAIGILLTIVIILGGGILFTCWIPVYHYQYFISFTFNKQGEDNILRVGNATPILDHPIKSIADINNLQAAFEKQEKWNNLTILSVTKL